MRSLPTLLLLATATSFAAGCRPATEVMLELTTDALCVDVLSTSITVGALGELEQRPPSTSTVSCADGRIGSIGVVPSGSKRGGFAVQVVAGVGKTAEACVASGYSGGCIVARRALNFVPDHVLALPIELEVACVDIPCGATETCRAGACVSAVLEDPEHCTDPAGCAGPRPDAASPLRDAGAEDAETEPALDAGAELDAMATSDAHTLDAVAEALDASSPEGAVGGEGDGAGMDANSGFDAAPDTSGADASDAAPTDVSSAPEAGGDADADAAEEAAVDASAPVRVLKVTTLQDVVDGDMTSIDALLADPGPDGVISLREAIRACNATPNRAEPDRIQFALSGTGPFAITVQPPGLPAITDPVAIAGSAASGAADANRVELDGAQAGAGVDGLSLTVGSDGSSISGLALNRFGGSGIRLDRSGGHVLRDLFLGISPNGTSGRGNYNDGVSLSESANNLIGGRLDPQFGERNVISGNGTSNNSGSGIELTGVGSFGNRILGNIVGLSASGSARVANLRGIVFSNGANDNMVGSGDLAERNVISGNFRNGVRIEGLQCDGNVVRGNYIGTDANDSGAQLGNDWAGVRITQGPKHNVIGGTRISDGNRIRYNGIHGVRVDTNGAFDNAILGNQISDNTGLGIDLADDVVTPNDPGDLDTGANDLLNFPEFVSASYANGQASLSYSLDLKAGDYRIEFFAIRSAAVDSTGYGEGELLLHAQSVTHSGQGPTSFSTQLTVDQASFITATCTEVLGSGVFGSSSEFSLAIPTTYPP